MDYNEKAGMRVLAIAKSDQGTKEVVIFGRGVMTGAEVPHGAVGALAEGIISENSLNPRIELDTGEIIWGCECWWLPEQKGDLWLMEMEAASYRIKEISIDGVRKHFRALGGKYIDEQKKGISIADPGTATHKRHRRKRSG